MSKWLKGKEKLFNQFKEEKKQEQEQQQAGPRRTDIIWPTPVKGSQEKPKIYELRLLCDKNGNFYKTFHYHMYKSPVTQKWVFVLCPKTYGMERFCAICAVSTKLWQGSKEDKNTAKGFFRKRKHCVNVFVGNDPRDADATNDEEKMNGKVKIYDFPDIVESKIKSEMNNEAYGAGINIFDPGEDGVDLILMVGSTKPVQEEGPNKGKSFHDYGNSKFSSKSRPILDSDEEIETVMDSVHDLDEYLKGMERTDEELIELMETESLLDYIVNEIPKNIKVESKKPKNDEPQGEQKELEPDEKVEEQREEKVEDPGGPKEEKESEPEDNISDEELLAQLNDL